MKNVKLAAGATKFETVLLCTDATCGRCFRCTVIQTTKQATAQLMSETMAVQAELQAERALVIIQREALRTLAARVDDEAMTKAVAQLIESTPAQALAALTASAPVAETDTAEGAHE